MTSKELVLKAEMRKEIGSRGAVKLRKQNKVPAVIYGHKQTPESIVLDAHEFAEGLGHGQRLYDLQIGSKKEKMLLKDVQYDHLGKKIIHADFVRVDLSERVKVEVAINYKGIPAGAQEGGVLEVHLDQLEIECAVTEIPEAIDVSVKALKVGESIHASDVVLPAGIKLLTPPEALLIACHEPIAAAAEEEVPAADQEAASPEVITERKQKEGEESEEK
ncbi:MAG: 50S ribosomal protein L25 [Phycisphaerae bacterium]|nr:50S ribosomal protein L25 [Phycisphaerae bacterium]